MKAALGNDKRITALLKQVFPDLMIRDAEFRFAMDEAVTARLTVLLTDGQLGELMRGIHELCEGDGHP